MSSKRLLEGAISLSRHKLFHKQNNKLIFVLFLFFINLCWEDTFTKLLFQTFFLSFFFKKNKEIKIKEKEHNYTYHPSLIWVRNHYSKTLANNGPFTSSNDKIISGKITLMLLSCRKIFLLFFLIHVSLVIHKRVLFFSKKKYWKNLGAHNFSQLLVITVT